MAEVTGRIGDNDVSLDNAATETTLRALLLATAKSSKEMDKLLKLAAKAGMNPKDIEAANKALKEMAGTAESGAKSTLAIGKSFSVLNVAVGVAGGVFGYLSDSAIKTAGNLTNLAGSLMAGSTNVSDFANAFKGLPLGLGMLASIIGKVIALQEQEFETYKKLTNAGINFAGGLTDLRTNATSLGLTLDQFGSLLSDNSETLAMFAGSANDGAKNFVKLSSTLKNSPLGQQLHSLGFGFEEMNRGVMNYVKIRGGATAEEMKDAKKMAEAAGEYIKQQDLLARLTGKSVESQQKIMEEESANAAWQNHLLTLSAGERAKAEHAHAQALATGGKGAADALRGQLMGIPPMTEAGRMFISMGEHAGQAMNQLAEDVKNPAVSLQGLSGSIGNLIFAIGEDGKKFVGPLGAAMIAAGGAAGDAVTVFLGTTNRLHQQGVKSHDDMMAFLEKAKKEREAQETSQAAEFAKAKKALSDIGTDLQNALGPLLKELTPIVSGLVVEFKKILDENMPTIKENIKIFADKLKEFGQNLFTEEGRAKIMNDIVFFFEDVMVGIKQALKIYNKDDAAQARAEIAARRKESDDLALVAKARVAVERAALTTPEGESPASIDEGLVQSLEDAINAAAISSQERQQTVIDVSTPQAVAKQDAINKSLMTTGERLQTSVASALETVGSWIPILGSFAESAKEARVKSDAVQLRKQGRQTGLESYEPKGINVDQVDLESHFPGMSKGGIASGPESGYLAMLHGTEAVIPLGNSKPTKESLPDILRAALSNIGSAASKALEVPKPLTDLINRIKEDTAPQPPDASISKMALNSDANLEKLVTYMEMLNKQTAEMLEHIKISAEFDRRNLDALNDMSNNSFIRA
jgi:hypothetical protein